METLSELARAKSAKRQWAGSDEGWRRLAPEEQDNEQCDQGYGGRPTVADDGDHAERDDTGQYDHEFE
jgi:hypothetical protein